MDGKPPAVPARTPRGLRSWWATAAFIGFVLVLFATILYVVAKHGRLEIVEYDSIALATKRKLAVYLPPKYDPELTYPVLYLLHGAGVDPLAWPKQGSASSVLDGLHLSRKVKPMIVVMPNSLGRGSALESDLLNEIIPLVESRYPVQADRDHRAIAGVSMGGGQALRIGLKHPDQFGWVGGFAPSLFGKEPAELLDDVEAAKSLRLLWLSCGDQDHLLPFVQSIQAELTRREVPHEWHVGAGEHEWKAWQADLGVFAPKLFRSR